MANMSPTRNEMPVQAPDVRNKNFSEVALGYTEEQAIDEALPQLQEQALLNRMSRTDRYPCIYRSGS